MSVENKENDLKDVAQIINALLQSSSNPDSYQKTIEQVSIDFEQILEKETKQLSEFSNHKKSVAIAISALRFFPKFKERNALMRQIKMQSDLSERQIRLAINAGILTVRDDGSAELNESSGQLLSQEKGIAYLFLIGILSGLVIAKLLYQPVGFATQILCGLGLGMAVGSLIGLVLDRSFRAYPVMSELKRLSPWLNAA